MEFRAAALERPLAAKYVLRTSFDNSEAITRLRNRQDEKFLFDEPVLSRYLRGEVDMTWVSDGQLYAEHGFLQALCSSDFNHLQLIKQLLSSGVSPNVALSSGNRPPIFEAIFQRNVELLGACGPFSAPHSLCSLLNSN